MRYILDTHIWIWMHYKPESLSHRVRNLLVEPGNYEELLLSVISIWELCKLVERKKINSVGDLESWINKAIAVPKLRIVQLTPQICIKATSLPDFHSDPSDQIIVATALNERATIVTKDREISSYKPVRVFW